MSRDRQILMRTSLAKQLRGLSVLIVDDAPHARQLMKLVFAGLGVYQVFMADSGRAALKFLGETEGMVDLIVCDWRMPQMTGLELLQQVRTVYPDMPFMMVTGKSDTNAVKEAKRYGVNAYLAKPYSPQEVEKKIISILSRHPAWRDTFHEGAGALPEPG